MPETETNEQRVERVARAMEPGTFATFDRVYTCRNMIDNRAFLNAEKAVKRARKKARAADAISFQAGWDAAQIDDREKVAAMMLRLSIATGHGDTFDDLLIELEGQLKEIMPRPKPAISFQAGWDAAVEALRATVADDASMRRAANYLAANRPGETP